GVPLSPRSAERATATPTGERTRSAALLGHIRTAGRALAVPAAHHLARNPEGLRALTQRRRASSERAPARLLPGTAAAHRADRQGPDDRHPVTTLRAMELTLDRVAGRPELDVFVRCRSRIQALPHADPLRVPVAAFPP